MPTGYTYDVSNGKITNAKDFILRCSRAFGATIMMRDEPMNAPIPEFHPHSYNLDALEEAKGKLEELNSLNHEEITKRIELEHWYDTDKNKKIREEKAQERQRYLDMLDKVKEWEVPTPDHIKLKEFCINQLHESMKYGFSDKDLDEYYPLEITKQTIQEWLECNITKRKKDIEYHSKEWEKEVERTKERNIWIEQLKDSLE